MRTCTLQLGPLSFLNILPLNSTSDSWYSPDILLHALLWGEIAPFWNHTNCELLGPEFSCLASASTLVLANPCHASHQDFCHEGKALSYSSRHRHVLSYPFATWQMTPPPPFKDCPGTTCPRNYTQLPSSLTQMGLNLLIAWWVSLVPEGWGTVSTHWLPVRTHPFTVCEAQSLAQGNSAVVNVSTPVGRECISWCNLSAVWET